MSAAAVPTPGLVPVIDLPALACRRWATLISFVTADLCALCLSGGAAVLARHLSNGQFTPGDYLVFAPALLLFFTIFLTLGLYPGIGVNPVSEFRRVVIGTGVSYLVIIACMFFTKESSVYSRLIFLLAAALSIPLLVIFRSGLRSWCAQASWWGVPTVIVGAGEAGQWALHLLRTQPELGFRPIALLDPYIDDIHLPAGVASKIVVGDLSLAPVFAQMHQSCYAVLTMPGLSTRQLTDLLCGYSGGFSQVFSIPDLFRFSNVWIAAKEIGGFEINQMFLRRLPRLMKRGFDLALAIAAAILLLPLLAAIYLAVRLTSRGPVLYGQKRVGVGGQGFTAWKFRSMIANADAVLQLHLERDRELRAQWKRDHKLKNDPRVTRVGKWLRKTSLDELPQIWNVIRGEMSLVGPRPIVTAEIPKYGRTFDLYCKVRPGITGMWQISGRNDTGYDQRVRFDEYYVRYWSIWLDAYILFRTFKTVLLTEGAY